MPGTNVRSHKGNDHEQASRDSTSDRPIDRPDHEGRAKPQLREMDFQFGLLRVAVRDRIDDARSIDDTAHVRDRTDRKEAMAPSRKAGAAACEMTSES